MFEQAVARNGNPIVVSNSFSGNERNRLFIQRDGNFDDFTLVSGADFLQDCRNFALVDFDRDGWLDVVVRSAQNPQFHILRNQFGSLTENNASRFLRIQLVGGNDGEEPSSEWSSRDAIGAKILVTTDDGKKRLFVKSCGEGLAVQNSSLIHVGLGAAELDSIEVTWPSGKTTSVSDWKVGGNVVVNERE